jgi:site-specific recombinase XerD
MKIIVMHQFSFLKLTSNEKLSRVRDFFCFACFTGARYSDVPKIQHEELKNDKWYLRTAKTKDLLEIPIIDEAQIILNRYKDNPQPIPVISNQKTNKYIKEISKVTGIHENIKIVKYQSPKPIEKSSPKYELIATHTARRTFITLPLEKGMSPEIVMEIKGHKDYKMMLKYLKITENVKETEMKKY